MAPLPLWRSLLFVPATAERFLDRAADCGADGLIIDLEDAVAPSQKEAARAVLPDAVARVGRGDADVLVRINRPLRMAVRDIEAAVLPGVAGLMLPKVESAEHIRLLSETVAEIERSRGLVVGGLRFLALIETARGFHNAHEIAAADARMVGLTLGGEDFAAEMGMADASGALVRPYMRAVQVAARGAGILALGYPDSIANFSDLGRFASAVDEARAMGLDGGSAIHPSQVPILNHGFAPPPEDVATAERIVAAYDAALASGLGAIEVDGRMIDIPVADRARRVLAMRDRIRARSL